MYRLVFVDAQNVELSEADGGQRQLAGDRQRAEETADRMAANWPAKAAAIAVGQANPHSQLETVWLFQVKKPQPPRIFRIVNTYSPESLGRLFYFWQKAGPPENPEALRRAVLTAAQYTESLIECKDYAGDYYYAVEELEIELIR